MAANKQVQGLKSGANSTANSRAASPTPAKVATPKKTGSATPIRAAVNPAALDISALNLGPSEPVDVIEEPPPKMALAKEKVLEEARKALKGKDGKKGVSLVVIGM